MAKTGLPKKYRALVTGGAGFIGSSLATRLVAEGHEVTVLDDLSRGRRSNVPRGAKFVRLSLLSDRLPAAVETARPDVVFHLAAHINVRESVANPGRDAEVNLVGALRLLRAAQEAKVRKFIFSSSGGAMYSEPPKWPAREEDAECPLSPYGVAKRSFEMYLESYRQTVGLNYVALRYANVYGPRQDTAGEAGVVAIFVERTLAGEPVRIFGDGEQTRDFVYVDDVVEANLLAAQSEAAGLALNIGTGREVSVNRIAALVAERLGRKSRIRHLASVPGELRRSSLDSGKARRQIGWRPSVSLEEGIGRTVDWFINNQRP